MGFGYLFLGYLLSFLLQITFSVAPLNAGPLAVLLGAILLFIGIRKLTAYETSFRLSGVSLGLLMLSNAYQIIGMVGAWAGATPAWMTDAVTNAVSWCHFAFLVLFHTALLYSLVRLALSVELKKTASFAICNLILVWLWAIFTLVVLLAPLPKTPKRVFTTTQALTNLAFILSNLALLLSCMKNIAPEEDADQPPHRYRWNFLNRVGDRFFGEHERAAEKRQAEAEAYLRRRAEKRIEKQNRKK